MIVDAGGVRDALGGALYRVNETLKLVDGELARRSDVDIGLVGSMRNHLINAKVWLEEAIETAEGKADTVRPEGEAA